MMRDLLEIVMLLGLMGGLLYVKNEFAEDKKERLKADKTRPPESDN